MHVFISYARTDRKWVAGLAEALAVEGHAVWCDTRLAPGDSFDDVIEKALDAAYAVIVVWSPASVGSNWVRAEAGEGLRRGVLAPVKCADCVVPLRFRAIHMADLSSWSAGRPHVAFEGLLDALAQRRATSTAPSAKQAAPPAGRRAETAPSSKMTAEYLGRAAKNVWRAKIALKIGAKEYQIEHKLDGGVQAVYVDGQEAARGDVMLASLFSCDKSFFFRIDHEGRAVTVELSFEGASLAGLHAVSMRVDGVELLKDVRL